MNLLFQAAQQARQIRERQELIFWTTAGPTTTFDPKITGVAGTWFFDDGTTIAAASGAEISKTFAAEGLHRAVYRPASGGLAAITAIDSNSDLLTDVINIERLSHLSTMILYTNACSITTSRIPSSVIVLSVNNAQIVGPLSELPVSCTSITIPYNSRLYGELSSIRSSYTSLNAVGCTGITGSIADLKSSLTTLANLYGLTTLTAGSIAHLIAIRDIRVYDMGWLTADVDTVIDSMWAARANYTYATGPSLQIGGTNQAPTGNVIAPIEGADWHQDGATWIPLTAGAKIYDLANNVNSEVRPSWAITYTA